MGILYSESKKLSPKERYTLILEEVTIDFNKVMYNWTQAKSSIPMHESKSLLRTYLSKYFKKYFSYSDYVSLSYDDPRPLLKKDNLLSGIELCNKYYNWRGKRSSQFQKTLEEFDFDKLRYNPKYAIKNEKEYEYDQETERRLQNSDSHYEKVLVKNKIENLIDYDKLNKIKF